jgi:hypothetical protein
LTLNEVHQHVAQGLQIISARLFDAQVRVDRGITSSAGQLFVLSVGNVLLLQRSVLVRCEKKFVFSRLRKCGNLGTFSRDQSQSSALCCDVCQHPSESCLALRHGAQNCGCVRTPSVGSVEIA